MAANTLKGQNKWRRTGGRRESDAGERREVEAERANIQPASFSLRVFARGGCDWRALLLSSCVQTIRVAQSSALAFQPPPPRPPPVHPPTPKPSNRQKQPFGWRGDIHGREELEVAEKQSCNDHKVSGQLSARFLHVD